MFSWLTGGKKKPSDSDSQTPTQQPPPSRSYKRGTSNLHNPLTPRLPTSTNDDDHYDRNYRSTSTSSSRTPLVPRSLRASSRDHQPTVPHHAPVLSAGYLTLDEGDHGWKRYWFVLSGSSVSDVALRYYLHTESAREGASASLGSMFLQGSKVVVIQEMIRITGIESTNDEWFLCADTLKEASSWSDKIEMASRAPEQCVEAVGGWGMGGDEAARLSYTVPGNHSSVCLEGPVERVGTGRDAVERVRTGRGAVASEGRRDATRRDETRWRRDGNHWVIIR